jgi:prolyl-tRNA editing enzyme YbaK/EbsC (Cys-tRNA(Pro) deacylase)
VRSKVKDAARELGLKVELRTLDSSTRTTVEAAAAVGCQTGQIAKSLVFICDGEPVVVVASGSHRVDTTKVANALDCAEVRQASPDEVRAATGFNVGGVPPIAHDLPVVFDEDLLEFESIYAAGGDGNTLFEVPPRNLAGAVHALIAEVGE